MKRLIFGLAALMGLVQPIFAQATVSGYTMTSIKVCTLGIAKACTTAPQSVLNLGGFAFQLWDSVKAESTATLTVKVQGAMWNKSEAFTASGFLDSLPVNAKTITAQGEYSQIYDISQNIPRVPFIRYILTNSGEQGRIFIKLGTAYNDR